MEEIKPVMTIDKIKKYQEEVVKYFEKPTQFQAGRIFQAVKTLEKLKQLDEVEINTTIPHRGIGLKKSNYEKNNYNTIYYNDGPYVHIMRERRDTIHFARNILER